MKQCNNIKVHTLPYIIGRTLCNRVYTKSGHSIPSTTVKNNVLEFTVRSLQYNEENTEVNMLASVSVPVKLTAQFWIVSSST